MKEFRNKEEQYNIFLKYTEADRKQNKNLGKTIFALVVLTLIISLGAFIYFICNSEDEFAVETKTKISKIFEQKQTTQKVKVKKIAKTKVKKNFDLKFLNRRQNILLVGVDSNGTATDPFLGTRSDTIMLVNIDPKDRSINVISIPRDSKVYIAENHGVKKINSAHALGGIELTKKTIEDTLGIRINKYVLVNNDGIKKLVDAIGGIPIYIEKDMYYNDYSANLHINLSKGVQVLDGEDVEGYLRFRKDGLGDIGRTSRQQWFLKALMEKLKSPDTITKIPEALKIANVYIKTDMSLYEMSQYAALARGIDLDSVEVATLPGGPNKKGYISYWILDPDKTQEVVDRMVYRRVPKNNNAQLEAGIMYAFDKEEEAMKIKERLKDNGYEVNCIGRASLPHSQVIGHNSAITSDFIYWLKKKVPEVKESQFVYDPNHTYCVKSDFTIIVAGS